MKLLSLLYVALIAKLCSAGCCCGGDGEGEALDLANPDSSKVDVKEETSYGVKWKVFTPKEGIKITSFTEGRLEIGKTNCGLKHLKIPLDTQTPLVIVGRIGACKPEKYFGKVDGKWKGISDNTLYGKLNAISKNTGKANEEAVNAEDTSDNPENSTEDAD